MSHRFAVDVVDADVDDCNDHLFGSVVTYSNVVNEFFAFVFVAVTLKAAYDVTVDDVVFDAYLVMMLVGFVAVVAIDAPVNCECLRGEAVNDDQYFEYVTGSVNVVVVAFHRNLSVHVHDDLYRWSL